MQIVGVAVGIALVLALIFALCALISALSGWGDLAQRFAAAKAIDGTRFRFRAVTMGRGLTTVAFLPHIFVTIGLNGLYISTFVPVGPPLFIPWTEIESMEPERSLFSTSYVITIRNCRPQITLYGKPGRSAMEAFESAMLATAL